ncbi:hypothetical protein D3C86_1692290 [compost metagenome]
MAIEHPFKFDGGNVLAARDDDVLEPVLDFDVTVGMPDGQVTGVEPAALERFGSGGRVLQVALHDSVAAQEDLADSLAVARGWLQRCAIADHHAFQGRVAHALS